jgi:2-iminobutanoate/2-iminopropanoate deaminase
VRKLDAGQIGDPGHCHGQLFSGMQGVDLCRPAAWYWDRSGSLGQDSQAASHPAARRWAFSKYEVASLAIARSIASLANQMEGKMPEPLKRSHIKREAAQARAYSQAVITEGGRTIWLAGQVAIEDSSGRSLAADFDGQVREVFARIGRTLEEAGASLADLVTMTVFITDARLGDRFTQLRREIFADNFPASALITVAGLARPEMLVEVQGVAVAR